MEHMRDTGKTSRVILRALLKASEEDNALVLFMADNETLVRRNIHITATVCYALSWECKIEVENRKITLPNGSRIVFAHVLSGTYQLRGIRWTDVFEDKDDLSPMKYWDEFDRIKPHLTRR